jgi:hypothetical protein
VDWDEELRKTERIRRKGFFVSALSFCVAAAFVLGVGHMNKSGIEFSRRIIFTFCLLITMFLVRGALRHRDRLRREREERENGGIDP